jgi:hypothetical protein
MEPSPAYSVAPIYIHRADCQFRADISLADSSPAQLHDGPDLAAPAPMAALDAQGIPGSTTEGQSMPFFAHTETRMR